MSGFKPVFLPPELAPTKSFSATFGRAYNLCQRAAFLYAKYRRELAPTHPLLRGSALHRGLQVCTLTAVEEFGGEGESEVSVPPELAKAIINEVLADPAYGWVPIEEHDYIRGSTYRWAREATINPGELIAVETLFELDLGPLVLRAKVDWATLHDNGTLLKVDDYKSARTLPAFEDIGRKRDDGTIAGKDYQLISYVLAIVFGVPIRESVDPLTGERVETREPFPLADRVQRAEADYVFPGIKGNDGLMARRGTTLTVLEMHEYLDSLRAQAVQIAHSVESGDWPAVWGESHCKECPCRAECPIPEERRDFAGSINTIEEAAEASEQLAAARLVFDARTRELNNFVKSLPAGAQAIYYGRNHVLEVGYQEAEEIIDRDAMWDAVDRAVEFGEPFDRAQHVRLKVSTPIRRRKLTEAELEERAETERTGL